jgi:hypothetical protein
VYRTISDDGLSYIKVMNLSSKVVCNKIYGRLQVAPALLGHLAHTCMHRPPPAPPTPAAPPVCSLCAVPRCSWFFVFWQHRILVFLMSLNVIERPVWLVRPGPVDSGEGVW